MRSTPARSDLTWAGEFRTRYAAWLTGARPLLRAHQYVQAFREYPWPAFEDTPWTPLSAPLARARLGVVTTAGVYRRGVDAPFADTEEGDPRIVGIPSGVDLAALDVSHSHIPEALARADLNVVLPLDHLRDLAREGVIGSLGPRVFSLVGYRTGAHEVAEETAPAIAAAMAADGITLALLVPV